MGSTLTGAVTIRGAEITVERGNYQTLERVHNDATRARDAAIARCNEEVEGHRSAEKIAEERKMSPYSEERLRSGSTNDATRARDAAIVRCNEEAEGHRSAEKIDEERKLSR